MTLRSRSLTTYTLVFTLFVFDFQVAEAYQQAKKSKPYPAKKQGQRPQTQPMKKGFDVVAENIVAKSFTECQPGRWYTRMRNQGSYTYMELQGLTYTSSFSPTRDPELELLNQTGYEGSGAVQVSGTFVRFCNAAPGEPSCGKYSRGGYASFGYEKYNGKWILRRSSPGSEDGLVAPSCKELGFGASIERREYSFPISAQSRWIDRGYGVPWVDTGVEVFPGDKVELVSLSGALRVPQPERSQGGMFNDRLLNGFFKLYIQEFPIGYTLLAISYSSDATANHLVMQTTERGRVLSNVLGLGPDGYYNGAPLANSDRIYNLRAGEHGTIFLGVNWRDAEQITGGLTVRLRVTHMK